MFGFLDCVHYKEDFVILMIVKNIICYTGDFVEAC